MATTPDDVIEKLNKLELRRGYTREMAEAVSALLVEAYDLQYKKSEPIFLYHWRMNKLAEAFSSLFSGWLGAAATSIGISFATDVSQDKWHLQKLEEHFKQIEPHIAGAINELRDANRREAILSRYKDKAA